MMVDGESKIPRHPGAGIRQQPHPRHLRPASRDSGSPARKACGAPPAESRIRPLDPGPEGKPAREVRGGVREDREAPPTCRPSGPPPEKASDLLRFLKTEAPKPFRRLEDLTAVDESRPQPAPRGTTTPSSTTCSPSRIPATSGSRSPCAKRNRRRPPSPASGPRRRLVRAGGLRHVRHRLRRPSGPAPHSHARFLAGPSPAQGASLPGNRNAPLHRRNGRVHAPARRRRLFQGTAAGGGRQDHDPQPRPPPSRAPTASCGWC